MQAMRPELLARLSDTIAPSPAAAVVAPLSFGQERMWFLNQLECQEDTACSGIYTEHLAFDLTVGVIGATDAEIDFLFAAGFFSFASGGRSSGMV